MTQISHRQLSPHVHNRIYEIFINAISETQSSSDVRALLEDFFTPTERVMLPKRLCIAFLLLKEYDQRTIASYLCVSFTTINRVSTALKTGGEGYKAVLDRIRKREGLQKVLNAIEEGLLSLLASAGGPSRVWKNLQRRQRIEKQNQQKPF